MISLVYYQQEGLEENDQRLNAIQFGSDADADGGGIMHIAI
jgi:hypothetical protein